MPESMRRFGVFLIALVQLGMPSWVAIADAHTLGPNPSDQVHVEPDGCVPSHPLDCHFCSHGKLPVYGGSSAPTRLPTIILVEAKVPETPRFPPSFTSCAAMPRAPPIPA